MWYNRAQLCHHIHLESDTLSAPPEAAGGFLRWLYSLGAAQFVPGLVIFHWLLLQSHRLQVRRVDVLQTEQTAPLGVKSTNVGANGQSAVRTLTYVKFFLLSRPR